MVSVANVSVEFFSRGADRLIRDEKFVERAISQTAKTAQKSEGTTKRWMERHKTALLAIGAATSGVMAGIIAASPDLSAAMGEVGLYFSMMAQEIGERWAPAFEKISDKVEALSNWFDKLPGPMKDVIAYGLLFGLVMLTGSGIVAGLTWLLTPLASGLGVAGAALGLTGEGGLIAAAGLSTVTLGLAVLAGAILGGVVLWLLWKAGVIQAMEDASAAFWQNYSNVKTVLGNLKDNILTWLSLTAQSAGVWGAQFALNWVEAVVSNIPILGDKFQPVIDDLKQRMSGAADSLDKQWAEFGGLTDGLLVGVTVSPPKANRTVSDFIGGADSAFFEGLLGWGETPVSSVADTEESRMAELWDSRIVDDYLAQVDKYTEEYKSKIASMRETTGTNMTATSEDFTQSLDKMDTAASTAGASIENTAKIMNAGVTKSFVDLTMKAPKWGSDLMGLFLAGLESRMPALESRLSSIRSMIESALSFDIPANDRMAMRWGSDLVSLFGEGMAAAAPQMVMPTLPPAVVVGASSSASGGNTYITIESGAVQVNGSQAKDLDERKIAQYVRDEVGNALRGRGR
jgi:hypothetical protein